MSLLISPDGMIAFVAEIVFLAVINTNQHDRNLSIQGYKIKAFFPVWIRFTGSFGGDSQI